MILKVQRVLEPADGPMLVYSKDRSVFQTVAPIPELLALMGKVPKVYVEGRVVPGEGPPRGFMATFGRGGSFTRPAEPVGKLIVERVVEPQPW